MTSKITDEMVNEVLDQFGPILRDGYKPDYLRGQAFAAIERALWLAPAVERAKGGAE